MQHFDNGAVFCRLLDANRGGYFQVRPTGRAISSRYYRVPGGVLETLFEASGGIIRLTDFMHSERLARSRVDPMTHPSAIGCCSTLMQSLAR